MSWAHKGGGFEFLDDVTWQDIGGWRIHLGDLRKECTACGKLKPLIDGFGQLRRMQADGNEYRTQAQCKLCRGEKP